MFKEFNDWFQSVLPGWKTQIVAWSTVALSTAAVALEYINTWTSEQWTLLVGTYAPYVGMAVGALVAYTRYLATRVA